MDAVEEMAECSQLDRCIFIYILCVLNPVPRNITTAFQVFRPPGLDTEAPYPVDPLSSSRINTAEAVITDIIVGLATRVVAR
jgi:hypothetical protein